MTTLAGFALEIDKNELMKLLKQQLNFLICNGYGYIWYNIGNMNYMVLLDKGENMKVIKYNKLIRDNIPTIIENSGKKAIIKKLTDKEYIAALNLKLGEELDEYLEDEDIEELADILEVIYGILDYNGVSMAKLEDIRVKKLKKRGAFKDRLMLVEVIEG